MNKDKLKKLLSSEMSIILVLVLLCIIISIITPTFATARNIKSLLLRTSSTGILAIGMTFVIATGGIDLSVGGQLTLMAVIGATFFENGWSIPAVILIIYVLGLLFGLFNGLGASVLKFPPFMVTLALQMITYGVTLYMTEGRSILIKAEGYEVFGLGRVAGIPVPVYIFVVVIIIGTLLLKKFTVGRKILAIGSNAKGAWYSGINVTVTTIAAYVIAGITAATASVILSSKLMSAASTLGDGMELDAIAAVVIGGTSLAGGNGYIVGTIAGSLIIEVISNWMTLQSVNPFLRDVVKGAIILLALLIDNIRRGKLTKNEFAV